MYDTYTGRWMQEDPIGFDFPVLVVSEQEQIDAVVVADALHGEAAQKRLFLDVIGAQVRDHVFAGASLPFGGAGCFRQRPPP